MLVKAKEFYSLLEEDSTEILDIEEIYSALRLSREFDQKSIKRAIGSATEMAEIYLGFSLKLKKWRLTVTGYLPSEIKVKMKPLIDVEKVFLTYQNKAEEILHNFEVDNQNGEIDFFHSRIIKAAQIDFRVGFSDKSKIPNLIKEGLFEHVGLIIDGGKTEEFGERICKYYQPFRLYRL
jgi:hypothetical protein